MGIAGRTKMGTAFHPKEYDGDRCCMNAETPSPVPSAPELQTLNQYLANALAPSLMPYMAVIQAGQSYLAELGATLALAMRELDRVLKPFLDEMRPIIQQFATADWNAIIRAHEKPFLYVANCGWTLPDWIGLEELHSFCSRSPEELDRHFVEGFMADDAENLRELGCTLKGIPELSQWHPLIDEIIASIEAGWFRVAIPPTFTIIEGYLSSALVKASLVSAKNTRPVEALSKAKWHENETLDAVYWKAGLVFLSRIFEDSDFTQQPPTFINRHWILHGRAPVDWTLSDALRLVNSLTTLHFLFVTIGKPKLSDPRRNMQAPVQLSLARQN